MLTKPKKPRVSGVFLCSLTCNWSGEPSGNVVEIGGYVARMQQYSKQVYEFDDAIMENGLVYIGK